MSKKNPQPRQQSAGKLTPSPRTKPKAAAGSQVEHPSRSAPHIQVEQELLEAKEFAESIVETLHEPLLVLQSDLTVKSANPAFYEHFQVDPRKTIGRTIYDLGNGQWDIPALRELLEAVLPANNIFNDFEVQHHFESIGPRTMLVNARRLDHVQLVLLGIRDITERKENEERLARERAMLDAMLDALPVGVLIADAQRKIIRCNEATRELWGGPPEAEAWEADRDWVAWWPESGKRIQADEWALSRALRHGEVTRNELIRNQRFSDGQERYYINNVAPMYDAAGNILGGVAAMLDVTERLVAEQKLRDSEERLRLAAEATGFGTYDYDVKEQAAIWSSQLFAITGYHSSMPLPPETMAGLIHEDDRVQYSQAVQQSLDPDGPGRHEIDVRLVRPDGHVRWIRHTGRTLFTGEGDERRAVRVVGTVQDITDRKRADEELRQSEERYRSLFESIDEGFCVVEVLFDEAGRPVDYRFLEVNPAFSAQTGIESPLGRRMRDIAPDHEEHWFETYGNVAESREAVRFRNRAAALGRFYDVFAFPIGEPEQRRVAILFNDVTEHLNREEELRQARDELEHRVAERTAELQVQTERLRRLARKLSRAEQDERRRIADHLHDDLQQLLVAALMRIGALEPIVNDPQARDLLNDIRDVVQQVSASSRGLTRQLRPSMLYEAGLVPALKWLCEEMRRLHELDVSFTGDADVRLNDDVASLLFESTRELLLNVVKHAGTGEAAVDVRVNDGCLRIRVSDEGAGFDADTEELHDGDGGLGLFSVRDRLAALGGGMGIDSVTGEGTTIDLAVPLQALDRQAQPRSSGRQPADFGEPPAAEPGQFRVLLVDDHAIVRQGIARLLNADQRYVVIGEASDGIEALTAVERLQPNVVLMDINMPRMNGVEATREIRQRHPDLPIIALSFHEEAEMNEAMIEAGASAYVRKGSDASTLFRTIDDHGRVEA